MASKPKEAWAFWANMNGPWWKSPQRVQFEGTTGTWWRKCGQAEVERLGLDAPESGGYITFAHESKHEVETFIAGFMAARHLLRNFVADE